MRATHVTVAIRNPAKHDRVWEGLVLVSADAEPMLGTTALESVGIEVNPRSQILKRLSSVQPKGLRLRDYAQGTTNEGSN